MTLPTLPTLPALSDQDRLRIALVVVLLVLWFGGLAVALLITRPRAGRPAPPAQDLGGDEPPAVVAFLVAGWRLTDDAAESTLIDLAARGLLEFRQLGADPRGTTVHRTAAGPDRELAGYERAVLERVEAVAVDRVVPLTALTFRDAGRAAAWRSSFAAAVIADARGRGLSRRRVAPALVTALGTAALLPASAAFWLVAALSEHPIAAAFGAALTVIGVLSSIAGRPRGERDTPAGRQVAARWLGLRDYLLVDEAFGALPPAAVTVWNRYLSYGDAVGATRVCADVIDLGVGDRRLVWSTFGGQWHRVRVRYPATTSRYGTTIPRMVTRSLVGGGLGYLLLRAQSALAADASLHASLGDLGLGLMRAVAVAAIVWFGYRLLRTVIDPPIVLRGEVLWIADAQTTTNDDTRVVTMHHLAVDDGRGDQTTAWALPATLAGTCHPGDVVQLRVRRWSRRVLAVSEVTRRDVDAVTSATVTAPAPAAGTAPPTSAASSSAASGAAASSSAAPSSAAEPIFAGVAALLGVAAGQLVASDGGDTVASGTDFALVHSADPADAAGSADAATPAGRPSPSEVTVSTARGPSGELLLAAHRGRGVALAGIGDEAWAGDGAAGEGWAVARRGDVVARVAVAPRVRALAGERLPELLRPVLTAALGRR